MARYLRLRVRPGRAVMFAGTEGEGGSRGAGEELVIRFEDAALFLRGKRRRSFEVIDDFEAEPGSTLSDLEPDRRNAEPAPGA